MLSTLADLMNLLDWFDESIRRMLDVRSKAYKSTLLLIGDISKITNYYVSDLTDNTTVYH